MVKRRKDQKLQITKLSTPEMRGSKQGQWLRIAGVNVALREDKENLLSVECIKINVGEETNAVTDTMSHDRAEADTKSRSHHSKPLNDHEVEVRREKGASEAEAGQGSPTDSRAKTF